MSEDTLEIKAFITRLLDAGQTGIHRQVISATDRILLETVLRHVNGNQVQASEILGISRTTLRSKLRILGITLEKHPISASPHRI